MNKIDYEYYLRFLQQLELKLRAINGNQTEVFSFNIRLSGHLKFKSQHYLTGLDYQLV